MNRRLVLVIVVVAIVVVAIVGAWRVLRPLGRDEGAWVNVPRDTMAYDNLPGEEVVVEGYLEANPRVIWGMPKVGKPTIISEDEVDRIGREGLKEDYILFRKLDWAQRLWSDNIDLTPSFEIEGKSYYVILSTGTEAWNSSKILSRYEGKHVGIRGKWDWYVDPDYPQRGTVVQLWARSIRALPQ